MFPKNFGIVFPFYPKKYLLKIVEAMFKGHFRVWPLGLRLNVAGLTQR